MAFSIQTNVASMQAQENLRTNQDFQARTITRLTSGYRINSSGDDAAGLAVANKFRSDTAELTQGVRNANDGLSQLQIIDGGLNNVSKMLDRLKTLATQSGSATYTGSRTTLDNEYQDILKEIDRQAANVGLSTGTYGGRNNADISVYTGGGGETQANSKVWVKLSGSANQVDSTGLGLSGTNVLSNATTALTNSRAMTGSTKVLDQSSTENFTFHVTKANGTSSDFTVKVDGKTAAGISGDEVVGQLNNVISGYGINASLDVNGKLQFSGDVAFSVRADATATGGGTSIVTANASVSSATMYSTSATSSADFTGYVASEKDTLTFKVGTQTASFDLTSVNAGTIDSALATLNGKLNGMGIYAVKTENAAGTTSGISLQSKASFNYAATHEDGTVAAQQTIFSAGSYTGAALAATDSSAPSNTTGTTTGAAEAAITKITAAVATLGSVQGIVGTGQNKLNYAINLAQSQISNFSAAESRVRDADVAAEAANLTKAQVLQQASIAAMAQANSAPQAVLSLLRG
jgi:flagellin